MSNPLLIRYTGEPDRIGRFGTVQTGQVLEVTLREYETAITDPDFEAVTEPEDNFVVGTTKETAPMDVLPSATTFFDLTKINWENPSVRKILMRRNKNILAKIGKAVESITKRDVLYGANVSREDTVSSILRAAKSVGWV